MALLIAGGQLDPNLEMLGSAAGELGVDVIQLRHGPDGSSPFFWELAERTVIIDDKPCTPMGAFVRHDVFAGLHDSRPEHGVRAFGWYQAVHGWLLTYPEIRLFNRDASACSANKPATLVTAERVGLKVPSTVLTNLQDAITNSAAKNAVVKPVAGGDYCYELHEVIARTDFKSGRAACPALIQSRLVPPEVRIYIIGDHAFSFQLTSDSLDYRLKQDVEIARLEQAPSVVASLKRLMDELKMNYGAADFKSDAATGELVFLELNSCPMFARFDLETKGELCRTMVRELCF